MNRASRGRRGGRGRRGRGGLGNRGIRRLARRMHDGVDRPNPRVPSEPPRLSWGQSYYTRTFRNEFGVYESVSAAPARDWKFAACYKPVDLLADELSGIKNLTNVFGEVRFNWINVWIMPAAGAGANGNYAARLYDRSTTTCFNAVLFNVLSQADGVTVKHARETAALKWRRSEPSDAEFISITDSNFVIALNLAGAKWNDSNESGKFTGNIVMDVNATLRSLNLAKTTTLSKSVSLMTDNDIAYLSKRMREESVVEKVREMESQSILEPLLETEDYDNVDITEFKRRIVQSLREQSAARETLINMLGQIYDKIPQRFRDVMDSLPRDLKEGLNFGFEIVDEAKMS